METVICDNCGEEVSENEAVNFNAVEFCSDECLDNWLTPIENI